MYHGLYYFLLQRGKRESSHVITFRSYLFGSDISTKVRSNEYCSTHHFYSSIFPHTARRSSYRYKHENQKKKKKITFKVNQLTKVILFDQRTSTLCNLPQKYCWLKVRNKAWISGLGSETSSSIAKNNHHLNLIKTCIVL